MRLSANDIYRMAQRAVEGAGAPPGLDVDAARAVEWLELAGLPGVAALAADLDAGLAAPAACRLEAETPSSLVFATASAMLVGAMAVEWAAAGAPGRQRVEGLVSPMGLLLEAEGRAGDCGGLALALLGAAGVVEAAAHFPAEAPGLLAGDWALPDRAPRTLLIASGAAAARLHAETPAGLDPSRPVAVARQAHLREGVEMDEAIWRRLSAHAARIFVPPSAVSRARGAGSGAVDDND
jgi:Protein of unknown function (DUF3726)